LIVVNSGGNDVLIYPGLGDGEFGPEVNGGHGFSTGSDPIGLTVADLNGDGIRDLVVANQGSNDLSILLGQGRGARWTLVSGERIKTGIGPKMTVVSDINGDGIPDILVSDGQSNDVRLIRGVGDGFFNDSNPTIYPTGINPCPLFVADFSGRPGQLDLVSLNAGSNDLTLVSDINNGGFFGQEIGSGGLVPIARVMGNFGGGGVDLLVANNGDGNLALFLGGNNGLTLSGNPFTDSNLPHPTDLALDVTTGQIYGTSEGIDAAFQVSLGLGIGGGGDGRGVGSSTLPSSPGDQQIAFLQPNGESALALLATILSVSIETTSEVTVMPNQPENDQVEITLADEGEEVITATPPPQATEIASSLANYLSGLDESFADARAASRSREFFGESRSSRTIQVLDSLIARWSPVAKLAGSAPSLATTLARWAVIAIRSRGSSASFALPKGPRADLARPISPTSGTEPVVPLLAIYDFQGGLALALADHAGSARARRDEFP
jgi:hypothetical protein